MASRKSRLALLSDRLAPSRPRAAAPGQARAARLRAPPGSRPRQVVSRVQDWPGDAGRRAATPDRGALSTSPQRRPRVEAQALRVVVRPQRLDGRAGTAAGAGRPAAAARPAGGTRARRPAVVRPGRPRRAPRAGAAGTARPGLRASPGRPVPSGGRGAHGRIPPAARKRQPRPRCCSARRSAGGIVRVRAPTSNRPPPHRAASPPGSHRTPGAATFPRERAPGLQDRRPRLLRVRQHRRQAFPGRRRFPARRLAEGRQGQRRFRRVTEPSCPRRTEALRRSRAGRAP
jgi:hypothetical protein